MIRSRLALAALVLGTPAPTIHAQTDLRAGPSSRSTVEITLSVPRPTSTGMPMAGMATSPAPAAPATKPLVIRLDYGQPHLRGRLLHTDSLVPYDKPWRLGANSSTTLTTDVDLVLGGRTLSKGTYVLYAIPSRMAWKLVVQRSVGQTPMQYSDSSDVARVDLRHTALPSPVESFTMWLIPSREPGVARGELRFAWGTNQLSTDWSLVARP